jgi:AcrR family transcriptional regulator
MKSETLIPRILELRAKGVTISAICARLGISRATYYRYVDKTKV